MWGERTELDPNGGCRQVGGSRKRSGPALQVELDPATQAGWPLSREVLRWAVVWDPPGVSGPEARRAALLSHAELSSGRGSRRRAGGAAH